MELNGKVAVVTGSARGIGKAIALELAHHGADVVVAGRSDAEREVAPGTIQRTAEEICALGRRAWPVRVDVGKQAGIDELVRQTMDQCGRVDILVNNAAVTGRMIYPGLWEMTRQQLEIQFAVNVVAPFMLTKLFTQEMKRLGGGIVINLTSGQARPVDVDATRTETSDPSLSYGTTKAALERLTNAMARELRPYHIACIALDPGGTMTELFERAVRIDGRQLSGHPPLWPARVAAFLATRSDPMVYSGRVVRTTKEFLDEHGLPADADRGNEESAAADERRRRSGNV